MKTLGLALRLPFYKAYKYLEFPSMLPFSYVLLLSTRCNSKCTTCGLWKQPHSGELSTGEWLKVIEGIGNTAAWVTVTGGEPFLIQDIDTLLVSVAQNIKPKVICIPTNATLPNQVSLKLGRVLKLAKKTEFIINLSVDELGSRHDKLRGFKGNFNLLLATAKKLKGLQRALPNLRIGVNTVISQHNIDRLYKIYSYVKEQLSPDDYIFETAQSREELCTASCDFKLSHTKLKEFFDFLAAEQKQLLKSRKGVSGFKVRSRIRYYKSLQSMQPGRCNAGLLSCQIMPDGKVVSCGVKAIPLGDLKGFGLDIRALWAAAAGARKQLRKQRCCCELANIFYINQI
jgi:MoaA/NifB/PqqE/SkfB family radical SAM enzyme